MEGSVVLWCLNSKNVIQELPTHKRQVKAVKFSPDGTRVVSCGSDFCLKVIDLKTGSILFSKGTFFHSYKMLEKLLNFTKLLKTWAKNWTVWLGTAIGSCWEEVSGNLSLWDLHQGVDIMRFPAHKGPVTVLAVSDDGDYVVTGGEDRRVVVWTNKKPTLPWCNTRIVFPQNFI